MKQELNFLETRKLVNEIKVFINNNSKIEKIYYDSRNNLYIQLYITGLGKQYLHFMDKFLYITDKKLESERASPKTLFLRKRLTNARIESIQQLNNERIIKLTIQAKENRYHWYFELYGQNDMILCDVDDKVIFSNKYKKNEQYNTDYDFDINSIEELKSLIENAKKTDKIVKTIAKSWKLGKIYANELCIRAKLDPEIKTQDITNKQTNNLLASLSKLIKDIDKSKKVYIIDEGEDIVPIKLDYYKDSNIEELEYTIQTTDIEASKKYCISYNAAISKVLDKDIELVEPKAKTEKKDKYSTIIEEQKALLQELKDKVDELNKIVELVYEDYNGFNNFIEDIKDKFKQKHFDEIKKSSYKKLKVKDLNKKDKTVILENV